MFLELEPYLNSKYSKYEEDVLIDPFLRPPICLIIISITAFVAAIIILILYDQVCPKIYIICTSPVNRWEKRWQKSNQLGLYII